MDDVRNGRNSGSRAVMAMFAVAAVAAAVAWVVNYNRGKNAIEFYGSGGAELIRNAPLVEFLQSPPAPSIDISKAPGLINARAALLRDERYDWLAPNARQESPLFSVRFKRAERSIVVTFDFDNCTVHASTTDRTARLSKKTADGWQNYLARQSAAHAAGSK